MFSRLITYQKAKQQQQEKPEKHKKSPIYEEKNWTAEL